MMMRKTPLRHIKPLSCEKYGTLHEFSCHPYTIIPLSNWYKLPPCFSPRHNETHLAVWSICAKRPGCLFGTVFGDMQYKYIFGSTIQVGYRTSVPDIYQVMHGLQCRESTLID